MLDAHEMSFMSHCSMLVMPCYDVSCCVVEQVRDIASMLAPVLDVVSNQPALQEPSKGPRTGPGAVVAAAAAMLQVS